MEKKEKERRVEDDEGGQKHQPPCISRMEPVQREAYGGGLYGKEEGQPNKPTGNPPASQTQSADGPAEGTIQPKYADGPAEGTIQPKYKPPPSTGDRNIDITGQSYIQ